MRSVLAFALITVCVSRTSAAEPRPPKPIPEGAAFTHVIAAETAYYKTGPQQGRPPDGNLQAGTKVQLLKNSGSYSQVRTGNGVVAHVENRALKELEGGNAVEITAEVRAIAESNNQFAFELYKRLHEPKGNRFFSPASISTALAMTCAGAGGRTKTEMADVLHFRLPDPLLNAGFGTLNSILNAESEDYRLSMANRLWGARTYPFQPQFLTTTRETYGAELAQVDFAEAEQARNTINQWVEEQTNHKIENLIPPGVLDSMTRLVLTNAIYFKGTWKEAFSKARTQEMPFQISKERKADLPMMRQTHTFGYAEAAGVQLLELPYRGNDLSMVVLLPKEIDGLAKLEEQLAAEDVQKWTTGLRKHKVDVFLPKFKLTSQFRLGDVLSAMGMRLAFSNHADFSGISSAEGLKISDVIHKAFVDVNEEGTEAAAATAVTMRPLSARVTEKPVVFRADHPFVFLIKDNRTGAILFLGRVVDPKE